VTPFPIDFWKQPIFFVVPQQSVAGLRLTFGVWVWRLREEHRLLTPRSHLSEFGDFGVDPILLFCETYKGGSEDLVCQSCGHVDDIFQVTA
jgi:hypothetical protein